MVSVAAETKEGLMTVTLLTVQTLTGSGTAITALLRYPLTPVSQNLIGSARITKVVLGIPGSSCSICSILATPLLKICATSKHRSHRFYIYDRPLGTD